MKIKILIVSLLLVACRTGYAAEELPLPPYDAPLPPTLEGLSDLALENVINSLDYEELASLRNTSTTLRNRFNKPPLADLLQTKLIEYWSQLLTFVSMKAEDPLNRVETIDNQSIYDSVVFSPFGNYVATGGYGIEFLLWQASLSGNPRRKQFKTIKQLRHTLEYESKMIYRYSVAFSPDGKTLAGASKNKIYFWQIPSGKLQSQFETKEDIGSISFISNELLAYQTSSQPAPISCNLLDIKTKEVKQTIPALLSAVSPDKTKLATLSEPKIITLWNIIDGRVEKEEIEKITTLNMITSLAFSPDGSIFAFGSGVGTINIWNLKTGARAKVSVDKEQPVDFLTFSPYGAILAAASLSQRSDGNKIMLWNVRTNKQIKTVYGSGPIAFSPDGVMFAAQGPNRRMKLWQKK